jgi:hypothetical protein
VRSALIATGGVVMGYAVLGAATDPDFKPGGALLFLAAVLVAHDALLLPMTIAGGALFARFAPRWALPSVRAAAIVSIAVVVVALPLVLGYGRAADNPSILPLAYGRGLILIMAMTWAAALASAMIARYRANRPKVPYAGTSRKRATTPFTRKRTVHQPAEGASAHQPPEPPAAASTA